MFFSNLIIKKDIIIEWFVFSLCLSAFLPVICIPADDSAHPPGPEAEKAKSVLDIDFSEEEVNEIFSKVRPLSPEELEQASGGGIAGAVVFSTAGALAGTYVGSAFGPVGGVIGGCIGAVGGGAFGYYLWEDNL